MIDRARTKWPIVFGVAALIGAAFGGLAGCGAPDDSEPGSTEEVSVVQEALSYCGAIGRTCPAGRRCCWDTCVSSTCWNASCDPTCRPGCPC
jgi:hypothetical protein